MKTNLRRKLALSGLTLGIAAMSVTASTFAWLTSNSVASTTQVSGSTGADTNLFVRGDADDYFSNNAKFSIGNVASGFTFTNATYKDFKFQTMNEVTGADKDTPSYTDLTVQEAPAPSDGKNSTNQTAGVMAFHVQFQASKGASIYLKKAEIRSTGETSFVLKGDAGEADGVKKGKSLTVKLEDALSLSVADYTSGSGDTYNHYRNVSVNSSASYNAVTYFNSIMNTKISSTLESGVFKQDVTHQEKVLSETSDNKVIGKDLGTSIKLVTMPDTVPEETNGFFTKVDKEEGKIQTGWITFYLWLNGWDNECFDAVRNQSLTAMFTFETAVA